MIDPNVHADPIGEAFYTRPEPAGTLNCHTRTLDRLHTLRKGPPRVKVGNTILYPKEPTVRWLETEAERVMRRRRKGWAA